MLRIEHRSAYRYGDEVLASYNEARMTPLTTDRQTAVESRVEVEPRARTYRYLDYWASVVDVFDIHVPHTTLHDHGDVGGGDDGGTVRSRRTRAGTC